MCLLPEVNHRDAVEAVLLGTADSSSITLEDAISYARAAREQLHHAPTSYDELRMGDDVYYVDKFLSGDASLQIFEIDRVLTYIRTVLRMLKRDSVEAALRGSADMSSVTTDDVFEYTRALQEELVFQKDVCNELREENRQIYRDYMRARKSLRYLPEMEKLISTMTAHLNAIDEDVPLHFNMSRELSVDPFDDEAGL